MNHISSFSLKLRVILLEICRRISVTLLGFLWYPTRLCCLMDSYFIGALPPPVSYIVCCIFYHYTLVYVTITNMGSLWRRQFFKVKKDNVKRTKLKSNVSSNNFWWCWQLHNDVIITDSTGLDSCLTVGPIFIHFR